MFNSLLSRHILLARFNPLLSWHVLTLFLPTRCNLSCRQCIERRCNCGRCHWRYTCYSSHRRCHGNYLLENVVSFFSHSGQLVIWWNDGRTKISQTSSTFVSFSLFLRGCSLLLHHLPPSFPLLLFPSGHDTARRATVTSEWEELTTGSNSSLMKVSTIAPCLCLSLAFQLCQGDQIFKTCEKTLREVSISIVRQVSRRRATRFWVFLTPGHCT